MTDVYQLNLTEAIFELDSIAESCPPLWRDIKNFIEMIENHYDDDLDEEGYFDD